MINEAFESGAANDRARAEREEYLAQLTRCLQDRLSPLETFDQVTEIRSHLDSMALAYAEMGTPPDQAMRSALAKFGAADQVGRIISDTVKVAEGDKAKLPLGLIKLLILDSLIAVAWAMLYTNLLAPIAKTLADNHLDIAAGLRMSNEALVPVAVAIGTACWYLPQVRPLKMGLICLLLFNIELPLTMYRMSRFMSLSSYAYIPFGHSLGVFVVAVVSVYLAQALRKSAKLQRPKAAV